MVQQLSLVGGPGEAFVLRYGSDPLKTYLPESDIDVTVLKKTILT